MKYRPYCKRGHDMSKHRVFVGKNKRPGCSECIRLRAETWHKNNKEYAAHRDRLRSYGITKEEYDRLLTAQDNRCAICLSIPEDSLCVDHDHITLKIRGLLCRKCNSALGLFLDNEEILSNAGKYLKRSRI